MVLGILLITLGTPLVRLNRITEGAGATVGRCAQLREEIVAYIEAYAASFRPPLREGVAVRSVRKGETAAPRDVVAV